MRRLLIALGLLTLAAVLGVGFVLFQLTVLNPPVVDPTYPERQRIRRYRETVQAAPLETYPSFAAGRARVYRAAGPGRTVLLLPDSGTGAWLYVNYLATLGSAFNLNAVSLRGMHGAAPATTATFGDYLQDARDALAAVTRQAPGNKAVIVGNGLGSLLALRLANEQPAATEALVLLAPYIPRERTPDQQWLADFFGDRIYDGVFSSPEATAKFWKGNFPNGIRQIGLARAAWVSYASRKQPYEYRPVVDEIVLGRIPWLDEHYRKLEEASFPVMTVGGRYDTVNPEASQLRVTERLQDLLGERYAFSILNSGQLIPLDWKWKESVNALTDFLLDLRLDVPILEEQEQLEPGLESTN
ncbi:MAG TPA: alpha/beta hydrolase [Deinococcales bacterium]|nr:alpha/beta hydrolase [Deinococcales bacterium]